tara:strand:+ start:3471 stop:3677 length:207 start_codon:yes stop_codon:yes gene_type:complete
MKYVGKKIGICDHFCNKKTKKTDFYKWFSYLDNEFIKEMCESCALREKWGYNYKQTKGFKSWAFGLDL